MNVSVVKITRGPVIGATYVGRRFPYVGERCTVVDIKEDPGNATVVVFRLADKQGKRWNRPLRHSKVVYFNSHWDIAVPHPEVHITLSVEEARDLRDPGNSDESCERFNAMVGAIQVAMDEVLEEHDAT